MPLATVIAGASKLVSVMFALLLLLLGLVALVIHQELQRLSQDEKEYSIETDNSFKNVAIRFYLFTINTVKY